MTAFVQSQANASVSAVNLGVAQGYAVLAGAAFTEGASNVICGDTIFGVVGATSNSGFAASTAFADAKGRTATFVSGLSDFGVNRTLTAGVHKFNSYVSATGTLTLDGENDPNAVFIFQIGGYLSTEAGFNVVLVNGANPDNIFWQVDTYFSPGASTMFKGTVMAGTYITTGAGFNLVGRLFAISGAVTTGAGNNINIGPSFDRNNNGILDTVEIALNPSIDCNLNGIIDDFDLLDYPELDCNLNGRIDTCDFAEGTSDEDLDGHLDECEWAKGDLDLSDSVNTGDLGLLLLYFGEENPPLGDLNGDSLIDSGDLSIMLLNFGDVTWP